MVLYFDPHHDAEDGMAHVKEKVFAVCYLYHGTGESLHNCLKVTLAYMQITPLESKTRM